MIKWKKYENRLDGYESKNLAAYIYNNDDGFLPVIITSDGYLFVFGKTPSVQIAKDVCSLASNEYQTWEWWIAHHCEWLELQV